jgi:hypothetical protein
MKLNKDLKHYSKKLFEHEERIASKFASNMQLKNVAKQ